MKNEINGFTRWFEAHICGWNTDDPMPDAQERNRSAVQISLFSIAIVAGACLLCVAMSGCVSGGTIDDMSARHRAQMEIAP